MLALLAVGWLIAGPTAEGQPGAAATPVKVAAVSQGEVAAGQAFVGTVTPIRKSIVGSAVAGRIVAYPHNEGDYVKEGDVLAQVLTGTIEIELAEANAELKVREAELDESTASFPAEKQQADARLAAMTARHDRARTKFRRVDELYQRKSSSEEALDEARAAELEAAALHQEAEAARRLVFGGAREQKIVQLQAKVAVQKEAVRLIEDRIAKYTIRAYFDGYVTAEQTEVGHWIKEGEPVAEIAELDSIDVRVNVPEDSIADLDEGATVRVEVGATRQKSFFGTIAAIVPQADLRARTFPVLVRIENPKLAATGSASAREGRALKSGMLARAILPVGRQKSALLISKDALVLGGRVPIVYAVEPGEKGAGGTVRPVPVELGVADGSRIQVSPLSPESGLKPGDLVVVEGNERLRPGQAVVFEKPATAARGDAAASK